MLTSKREFIDNKITDEDPLRGLLFYQDLVRGVAVGQTFSLNSVTRDSAPVRASHRMERNGSNFDRGFAGAASLSSHPPNSVTNLRENLLITRPA